MVFPGAPIMMEGVFRKRPMDQRQPGQRLLSAAVHSLVFLPDI